MRIAASYALMYREGADKASSIYTDGWKMISERIRDVYPDITLVLHHDSSVPAELLALADSTVAWPRDTSCECMFWRFTTVDSGRFDAVLVRDIDSVPNQREADAVQEWLESDFKLHTMHDHQAHRSARVLGGMWGAKRDTFPYDFPHLVKWWIENRRPFHYDSDQQFLTRYVYPYAERGGLNHWGTDQLALTAVPFPGGPSPVTGFVGERVDTIL